MAGHIACVGKMRNAYKIMVGNLKSREHLQDIGVDGRIISEWTLEKQSGKVITGFIWLRPVSSGGLL
jgi:hypothetical protein